MDDTNLLSSIRGVYIASAGHSLPNPETATSDTRQSTIEVPNYGLVTITFERFIYRHGRNRFTTWKVVSAVRCGG